MKDMIFGDNAFIEMNLFLIERGMNEEGRLDNSLGERLDFLW